MSGLPATIPPSPPAPSVVCLGDGAENAILGDWPDRRFDGVHRAELHSHRIAAPRAMALVCVGGGYTGLVYDKEGTEIALWLNAIGLDAHILIHRLPGGTDGAGLRFGKDIALRDGLNALELLADRHPDLPLFHVGLSSGGHLSAVLACHSQPISARGVLIGYAPLNANHRDHKFPPGKPDYPPIEKQDFYDDWPIGLTNHEDAIPHVPVFLAYALRDKSVPVQHATRLIETAARQDLDLDAHIFGAAPHGFALRDRAGSHVAWPDLARQWFDRFLA
ncbi:alpha/beta hydrolase family protein [Tropicimonas marinistellae]|uniref:alpha/beta hydrolase family protein n=1 Tax=Tropicimonas marinistellae TaxID=1739787 RepID=UPI000AC64A39|nr:dienelactone hydrolase family protein [Tropicimonas marinistellae]